MALQDPSRARPKRGICGIERLLLEHLRQRNLGVLLRSLADSPIPDQRVSREVAERLLEEHARHVEDDEEAFFPLIAAHLPESDPLHRMLEDLRQDHALIGKLVCDAVSALEASLHRKVPVLTPPRGWPRACWSPARIATSPSKTRLCFLVHKRSSARRDAKRWRTGSPRVHVPSPAVDGAVAGAVRFGKRSGAEACRRMEPARRCCRVDAVAPDRRHTRRMASRRSRSTALGPSRTRRSPAQPGTGSATGAVLGARWSIARISARSEPSPRGFSRTCVIPASAAASRIFSLGFAVIRIAARSGFRARKCATRAMPFSPRHVEIDDEAGIRRQLSRRERLSTGGEGANAQAFLLQSEGQGAANRIVVDDDHVGCLQRHGLNPGTNGSGLKIDRASSLYACSRGEAPYRGYP
jgi:hypothetical protein